LTLPTQKVADPCSKGIKVSEEERRNMQSIKMDVISHDCLLKRM
jgi:hypothetical protein